MSVLPVPLGERGEVGRDVVRRASPRLDHHQPDEEEQERAEGGAGRHIVVGTLLGGCRGRDSPI